MLIPGVPSAGSTKPPGSSPGKAVYTPKGFFPHAGWLGHPFGHCPRFPTAAPRRGRARVSVPVWPTTLSGRLPVVGLVGHYPTNYLMGRAPLPEQCQPFRNWHPLLPPACASESPSGISPPFGGLSPSPGQVRHVLRTRPPLRTCPCLPEGRQGKPVARLACVRPPASVHPEPPSNSPWYKPLTQTSASA